MRVNETEKYSGALGAWGVEAAAFVAELGRRMTAATGDPRETSFTPSASLSGNPARQRDCLPRYNAGGGRTKLTLIFVIQI